LSSMSWAQLHARPPNHGAAQFGSAPRFQQFQSHNGNSHGHEPNRRQHAPPRFQQPSNRAPPRFKPPSNRPHNNPNQQPHSNQRRARTHMTRLKPQLGAGAGAGAGNGVALLSKKHRHSDIHFVILDSGALIGRQSFWNHFSPDTTYLMTPAINNEVRDKHSRQFLENFPFAIAVRKPEPSSSSFVAQFLAKNPTLRSLSKVDRQIIALAHSLEVEQHGTKHLMGGRGAGKAVSVVNGQSGRSGRGALKKSKTGRIHSQCAPMKDSGLRMAKMKKVIPFHLDAFLTLSLTQYGAKYGEPTHHDTLAMEAAMTEKADTVTVKDPFAETDARSSQNGADPNLSPISKAQRRRLRKRKAMANNKSASASPTKGGTAQMQMTAENSNLNELKLDDSAPTQTDAQSESNKSNIERMVEEDLTKTFDETASLLSEMSAHSQRQKLNAMQRNLTSKGKGLKGGNVDIAPQSAPSAGFGTLFTGASGSLFQSDASAEANKSRPTPSPRPISPLPESGQSTQSVQSKQNVKKKTVGDAWHGDWLTPDNFKKQSGSVNKKSKKVKLRDVREKKEKKESEKESVRENTTSSVAVITVDTAMQKAMISLGLRVLTTHSGSRQYGGGTAQGRNGRNEPTDYVFRCYGCFTMEHNTNRTHCRHCGGQTFQRVAIYEDEFGKQHYRYFYRDRFAHRYLDKHSLVPRGAQLVKYEAQQGVQGGAHGQSGGHRRKKQRRERRQQLGHGGGRW